MKSLIAIATLSSLSLFAVAPTQAGPFDFQLFSPFDFALSGEMVSLNPQPLPPVALRLFR